MTNYKRMKFDGKEIAVGLADRLKYDTKTLTSPASTSYLTLVSVNNYSGNAGIRLRMTTGGNNGYKSLVLNCVWAGTSAPVVVIENSMYTSNNCIRYFRATAPKTITDTTAPPEIHIAQVSALARTYVVEVLESFGGAQVMSSLSTATLDTAKSNNRIQDVNNYIGHYDNTGYIGTANFSNGGFNTQDCDRFSYGEAVVAGSLVALGSDGKVWKLRNTAKSFRLPLFGGRATGTFSVNQNWGRLSFTKRGIALSELTNTSMQTTAFTVPTWAIGDEIFLRGSLDTDGNFKPDGTIAKSMAAGYTWVPIGFVEKTDSATATYFTLVMDGVSAYTLDSSGKLTGINGKLVKDTTYSAMSVSEGKTGTATTSRTMRADYLKQMVLEIIYPVGSVYINASDSTNPATLLGFGDWEAFGAGRVPVGVDTSDPDFATVGKTDGEKTHKLTISEMPTHDHNGATWATENVAEWYGYDIDGSCGGGGTNVSSWQRGKDARGAEFSGSDWKRTWRYSQSHTHDIPDSGGGGAHNNLQPYVTVYMWKRTA